jgi:hypothetical protein
MKMPSYVNPEALLSDEDVDRIIQGHPSAVQRGNLIAHVAVTNAILKEMAVVADKERNHIASWLDEQGGIYVAVAKAVREGTTPTLEQPVARVDPALEVKLREALTEAVQQRDALQIEVEDLRTGGTTQSHPKPWAVRGKSGQMTYYDTRSAARREAAGGIVVDCR